jgi:CheY-like chemotaxis protein
VRPDLIVLDMMLPSLTGIEVLHHLRRDPEFARTPVLVLTAQPGTREDAIRAGANLVMDKPFDPEEFSVAVEEVLSSSP